MLNLDFEHSKIYVDEKALLILKYSKYKPILVNAMPFNQLKSSENVIVFVSSHLSIHSKELLELQTSSLNIVTFISEYSHLNNLDESLAGRWNVETDTYFEAVRLALSKKNGSVGIHYFSPAIWFSKNCFVLNSTVFPIFNEMEIHAELSDLLDYMNIKEVYFCMHRLTRLYFTWGLPTVDLDLSSTNLLDLVNDTFTRKDNQVMVPCELLLSKIDKDPDAIFTTCHGMDPHTLFVIDTLLNMDDGYGNQLNEFLFNIGEENYKDLDCLMEHEAFLVLVSAIIEAKQKENLELTGLDEILSPDSFMYQIIDLLKSKRFKVRDLLLLTMRMYNVSKYEIDPHLEENLKKEFVLQMTADPQKRKPTFLWIQKVFQQLHKVRSKHTKKDIVNGLFESALFKCATGGWLKRNVFDFQKILVYYVGGFRNSEVNLLVSKGREYGHEVIVGGSCVAANDTLMQQILKSK
ncbi:hypothetical protein HDV01_003662 [Terramyces sp. JEL0728]|nr:hypothetical protein HDV01_003662 [Terramyces sp. JEL0728]